MKRDIIVGQLIKEGFSEKTLVNFSNKQLSDLHERIVVDADKLKSDPKLQALANDPNTEVEVKEELKGGQKKLDKNHNGKIDGQDFKILRGQKEEVKEENIGRVSVQVSELKKGDILAGSKLEVVSVSSGTRTPSGKSDVTVKNPKTGRIDTRLWGKYTKVGVLRHLEKKEGLDESLHGIMISATKEKLKNALGRDAEDHEVEKEIERFVNDWKKDEESKKVKSQKKKEVKEWVENLAENNFHSFTSKNEIMELIQSKLNESEVMEPQYGSKVKKGHNGIPEFMTYDAIVGNGTKTAPAKPKVDPGTKPAKPKTPFQPGPGPNPKPKALKEKENDDKPETGLNPKSKV
jgi:hypothetical protein